MKRINNKTFTAMQVRLDGNNYENCTFNGCQLIYGGGKIGLTGCSLNFCRWTLVDGAINTLQFLSLLYQMPGAAPMIEEWIAQIKAGPPTEPKTN